MRISPADEQAVENGGELNYTIDIVDQAENPTFAPRMSVICKVFWSCHIVDNFDINFMCYTSIICCVWIPQLSVIVSSVSVIA